MRLIGILLLVLLIVVVSLALVLGIAIGIGWVLTLILPFTLFEGSLLGIIASIIVGSFNASHIINTQNCCLDFLRSLQNITPIIAAARSTAESAPTRMGRISMHEYSYLRNMESNH